jgi:hypothetical protein
VEPEYRVKSDSPVTSNNQATEAIVESAQQIEILVRRLRHVGNSEYELLAPFDYRGTRRPREKANAARLVQNPQDLPKCPVETVADSRRQYDPLVVIKFGDLLGDYRRAGGLQEPCGWPTGPHASTNGNK